MTPDSFFARVEVQPNGCWNWTGNISVYGYGIMSNGARRKAQRAHRTAWEIANAREVPADKMVCHHCDNRKCINPEHLYVGTAADNARDTAQRNREALRTNVKTHCKRGHPLSGDNVRIITWGNRPPARACVVCMRAKQARSNDGYAERRGWTRKSRPTPEQILEGVR